MIIEWLKYGLINTPGWVYAILFYLIFIGIRLSRPQVIVFRRLYKLPIILFAISLGEFFRLGKPDTKTLICWSLAIPVGIMLSWWNMNRMTTGFTMACDKEKKLIHIPGTWTTLGILLIVFFTKYYIGYHYRVDPNHLLEPPVKLSIFAILGACTGLVTGILFYACYYRWKGPHVNLVLANRKLST